MLLIVQGIEIEIALSAQEKIQASRRYVETASKTTPIYGINTGFGYFANKKIAKDELDQLQANLLRSHASGFGEYFSIGESRLAQVLRLNVLVKGYTGVRYELCQKLLELIQAGIHPCIPIYGSVGASGDLAPLAHLALPLIGEGKVYYKQKEMLASQALKEAKITPIHLEKKEGLSLVNGTQVMLAVGGLVLARLPYLLKVLHLVTALSYEALIANTASLDPLLHRVRNHKGQILAAETMLKALEGSSLFEMKKPRLQDPYSLRCAAQVHGASMDALEYATGVVRCELNGATDNPLVFDQEEKILSGGNFHGQPLALAFDFAAIALSEFGNISERRLELLLNPSKSGLNAFLAPKEGIHSGYMALQYLSASLVNECKLLANPSSTDSIPGNVGIEDHVSMGMTSARKLKKIFNHIYVILSTELLAACQAIDLREKRVLGKQTGTLYEKVRQVVPYLDRDRIIANDVDKVVSILKEGI